MDKKIDIDLIIWLVFLLLLFGGTAVKWLIHRFGRRKEEEATVQERPATLMEEFKKMLEGMVLEERPEIVIVEERPQRRRVKPVRGRVAPETIPRKEEKPKIPEVSVPKKEAEPTAPMISAPKASFWQSLPKDELQKAVVLSEILGQPRARRRHRLGIRGRGLGTRD
jgi:hypothetical protein